MLGVKLGRSSTLRTAEQYPAKGWPAQQTLQRVEQLCSRTPQHQAEHLSSEEKGFKRYFRSCSRSKFTKYLTAAGFEDLAKHVQALAR